MSQSLRGLSLHATAVVDPGAKLADGVAVGPYAVIGAGVELAPGVEVGPHAVIEGRTSVGSRTRIHAHVVLGGEPQIRREGAAADGERTLAIGEDCVIREFAVVHAGSPDGSGQTRIGHRSYLMNHAHVGHDGSVGSDCVLASYAALAGHVVVGDHAVLGAFTGVHQWTEIGESAFTAANTMVSKGVPPFARVAGDRARLVGLNTLNLERRGFAPPVIAALKHAYHLLFASRLRLEPAVARVRQECAGVPEVERLLDFLAASERGFVR